MAREMPLSSWLFPGGGASWAARCRLEDHTGPGRVPGVRVHEAGRAFSGSWQKSCPQASLVTFTRSTQLPTVPDSELAEAATAQGVSSPSHANVEGTGFVEAGSGRGHRDGTGGRYWMDTLRWRRQGHGAVGVWSLPPGWRGEEEGEVRPPWPDHHTASHIWDCASVPVTHPFLGIGGKSGTGGSCPCGRQPLQVVTMLQLRADTQPEPCSVPCHRHTRWPCRGLCTRRTARPSWAPQPDSPAG